MHNLFGALASALLILCLTSGILLAGEDAHPKKYGVEITLGGGYYLMEDVNDFVPLPAFLDPRFIGGDDDKINIGNQWGIGFSYRSLDNFGWVFGYNRINSGLIVIPGKFRINANFIDPSTGALLDESWVEQSLFGREYYVLPTWYWNWKNQDISLSVGPAVYRVIMDRSVLIYSSGTNPISTGSFAEADGTALGMMMSFGIEFPISEQFFLNVQAGGRYAYIGKLTYEDKQGIEQTVWLGPGSSSTMAVDFTGGFIKASIRTYFKPDASWRSPKR